MVGEISIKITHGSTPSPVRMPLAGQNVLPKESQIKKKSSPLLPHIWGNIKIVKFMGLGSGLKP